MEKGFENFGKTLTARNFCLQIYLFYPRFEFPRGPRVRRLFDPYILTVNTRIPLSFNFHWNFVMQQAFQIRLFWITNLSKMFSQTASQQTFSTRTSSINSTRREFREQVTSPSHNRKICSPKKLRLKNFVTNHAKIRNEISNTTLIFVKFNIHTEWTISFILSKCDGKYWKVSLFDVGRIFLLHLWEYHSNSLLLKDVLARWTRWLHICEFECKNLVLCARI